MMPLSMVGIKAVVLEPGGFSPEFPLSLPVSSGRSYGGSLYAPEIGSLALGHLLMQGS